MTTHRRPAAGDLAADFLPHAPPFLLLDRILELDERRGRFAKAIARADGLTGPGGVLPPLLMIEAMAQAGGIVLVSSDASLAQAQAMLAAIDRCEIQGSVQVGERLIVEVSLVRRYGDMARIKGIARVDDRTCATAALTLALVPYGVGT